MLEVKQLKKLIELCPDAQYEGTTYSADCEAKIHSILQCFYSCKFFDYLKQFQNKGTPNALKIFITGSASIGKSTAIEAIRIELIKFGLKFAFVNLRTVDSNNIDCIVKTLKERDIIVFDAYDELEEKFQPTIDSFILDKNKSIIISSRHEKYVKTKDVRISIFNEYKKIYLEELSHFQINRVLNKKGIKKTENEKLYNLLHNTMFLSIFLTINELNKDEEIANIDSEYALMELYFKELYRLKAENRASAQTSWKSTLLSAGEMTYNYMLSSSKEISFFNNDEFNNIILKDIISRDSNGSLVYTHQMFADFLVAYYLNKEISLYKNLEKLRFSTSPIWNGALYMLGQSLKADKATEVLFSSVKSKDKHVYKNVLLTYLGINNGVLDDKWDLIDRKFIRFAKELHFFRDNRQIKEINTKHFKTIKGIDIDDFYHCSKIKLVIHKSVIHQCDFANMFCLNSLKLCSGVKSIKSFAFVNCDNLTDIEISDTVKQIKPHAFFKCTNIDSIVSSNGTLETPYFAIEYDNIVCKKNKKIVLLCCDYSGDSLYATKLQSGAVDGYRLSRKKKIRLPNNLDVLPTKGMHWYSILYSLKEEKRESFAFVSLKSKLMSLFAVAVLSVLGKLPHACFGEGVDVVMQGDEIYVQNSWQTNFKVDPSKCESGDYIHKYKFRQEYPRNLSNVAYLDTDDIISYEQETKRHIRFWLWLLDKTSGVEKTNIWNMGYVNNVRMLPAFIWVALMYIVFAILGILWATTSLVTDIFNCIRFETNVFVAVNLMLYLYYLVHMICMFLAMKISELIYGMCFKNIKMFQTWLFKKGHNTFSIFRV